MESQALLVAKLTDAIAALQQAIGTEDTRKLLVGLAAGLGAPEEQFGPAGGGAPTEPGSHVSKSRLSPAVHLPTARASESTRGE